MLQNNTLYLCTVLLLLVFFSDWLAQKKFFRFIGSSLLVILAAAILSNLHIIPSSDNAPPLYNIIFSYVAPLAIFYLLLDVKLKDIKLAGLPMLTMFLLGAFGSIIGTFAAYYLLSPQNTLPDAFAISGMFTGTYIGGSVNLNAVALQYGVIKNGTLFAAINAADNIIGAIWIAITLVLPRFLYRFLPRQKVGSSTLAKQDENLTAIPKEAITPGGFALLLLLGIGTLFLSDVISSYLPQIPSILILTTLALILAQIKKLNTQGASAVGIVLVLVFLAVVGAYCDIAALLRNRSIALLLMEWVTIIVFIHGFIIYIIGGLLKQDWAVITIASNANIGGATTAGVLAVSLNRRDLRLPGILVGAIGTALGTYLGLLVAVLLR